MSNNYHFKGITYLEKDIDNVLHSFKLKTMNVCAYKIIDETVKPFLCYLFCLNNNNKNNMQTLYLPKINIENTYYDGETIIDFLKQGVINEISLNGKGSPVNKDDIIFNGLDFYDDEGYIFFDISKIKTIYDVKNTYRLILTNEILNSKSYIYKIDEKNVEFFTNNISYGLLYDANGRQCETPIALYQGVSKKELHYNFNVSIKKVNDIFGKGYYLTSCDNTTNKNECVIRIALFLGNMYIKENFPNDKYDTSINNNKNEKLLLRITDYNEYWKEKYDSIYVGKIELDNGEDFLKGPLYAFRKRNQYFSLNYEYV